jgi:hypothetical protein
LADSRSGFFFGPFPSVILTRRERSYDSNKDG